MRVNVHLLVVKLCSPVKREMGASSNANYACLPCMLSTQLIAAITGFSCGSVQGTKSRLKNQECLSSQLFHSVNDGVSVRKKQRYRITPPVPSNRLR